MKFDHLFFVLLLAAMLVPASSSRAQTDAAHIIECAKVPERTKRLACYDQRVNDLIIQRQSAPIASQKLKARPHATTRPAARQEPFGASWGLANRTDKSEELRAELTSFAKGPFGQYTFVLSNGQVWRQKDDFKLNLTVGDAVVLKRGLVSGFWLTAGNNTRVRVKRVK
ncbi:MAG: hypothetical protein ACE5EM_07675 [Sphingomonadales bacterium]